MTVKQRRIRARYEIEQLDLSSRTLNSLMAEDICKINQLIEMTEEQLEKIFNLGKKGIREITEALRKRGLSLKNAGSEWMPIHTAPRDGSWVLVYSCFSTKTPDYGVARWDEKYWLLASGYGVKTIFENPTHWMHLPYCPEAGQ